MLSKLIRCIALLLAISAEARADDMSVYGQAGLFGMGAGINYGDFAGRSYYAHAGKMAFIHYGVEHVTAGVKQRFGKSFYGRAGGGYSRALERPGALALDFGIGNEWRWESGFLLGGEWLNFGSSLTANGKPGGGWIEFPQVRVGFVF